MATGHVVRRVLSSPWNRETVCEYRSSRDELSLPRPTEITPFYGTEVTCNNRWLTAISFSSPLTSAPPSNPIHRPLPPLVRHLFLLPRGFDGTYLITSSNGFQTKNSAEYPPARIIISSRSCPSRGSETPKGMQVFLRTEFLVSIFVYFCSFNYLEERENNFSKLWKDRRIFWPNGIGCSFNYLEK